MLVLGWSLVSTLTVCLDHVSQNRVKAQRVHSPHWRLVGGNRSKPLYGVSLVSSDRRKVQTQGVDLLTDFKPVGRCCF